MIILFLERVQLAEIKKKFSEFNRFYTYLMEKRKILINKIKRNIILQKLRDK